jgi:hypothetical protein
MGRRETAACRTRAAGSADRPSPGTRYLNRRGVDAPSLHGLGRRAFTTSPPPWRDRVGGSK